MGRRHGKGGSTKRSATLVGEEMPRKLTREAAGERVTMIMGQMGRYLEIKRADLPLGGY